MSRRKYIVRRLTDLNRPAEDETGKLFGIPAGLNNAEIDYFMATPEEYRPLCGCRMGWKEDALYVWEYAYETELRMTEGGSVCRAWEDSCLEVFLAPDPERLDLYMNYECTPTPCVHLGTGTGRQKRKVFDSLKLPEGTEPASRIIPGIAWGISYRIPLSFLKQEFGISCLYPGMIMHGNFQKCGDLTRVPHYALWNAPGPEVTTPDFHRPEFFGTLILE